MITIEHGVNVIQYISHFIWASKSINSQFANIKNLMDTLHVSAHDLHVVNGWNLIPMLFVSIFDIWRRWNEMLGSWNSGWDLKGNMMQWGETGEKSQELRSAWSGELSGKGEYTEGDGEEQNEI